MQINKILENIVNKPSENMNRSRPEDAVEWTFADWYGADVSGEKYDGELDCSAQNLTSLKGCFSEITGDFNCSDNELTTLEDGPQRVSGRYICDGNSLENLNGLPIGFPANRLEVYNNDAVPYPDLIEAHFGKGSIPFPRAKLSKLIGMAEFLASELETYRRSDLAKAANEIFEKLRNENPIGE